jgi:hypothetical protein
MRKIIRKGQKGNIREWESERYIFFITHSLTRSFTKVIKINRFLLFFLFQSSISNNHNFSLSLSFSDTLFVFTLNEYIVISVCAIGDDDVSWHIYKYIYTYIFTCDKINGYHSLSLFAMKITLYYCTIMRS